MILNKLRKLLATFMIGALALGFSGCEPTTDKNKVDKLTYQAAKLFKEKNYPEAIKLYERAIELQPNNDIILSDLGATYIYRSVPKSLLL